MRTSSKDAAAASSPLTAASDRPLRNPLTDVPTVVFDYTGSSQNYTVPPGVTSIRAGVWGAQGGEGKFWCNEPCPRSPGGSGGYAEAEFPVTAGDVLTINVGGMGGFGGANPSGQGGWNGGGVGGRGINGSGSWSGGGGGGASSILRVNDALLVAGGGGGGGSGGTSPPAAGGGSGGAGGNPATNGGDATISGGSGGYGGVAATVTAGGTGGAAGSGSIGGAPGANGVALNGGAGGDGNRFGSGYRTAGGGGGGGGYFGGGGGGAAGEQGFYGAGGGGGGSSWIKSGLINPVFQDGVQAGNGRIELHPIAAAPVPTVEMRNRSQCPPVPDGLKYTVIPDERSTQEAPACPVLKFGAYTYWPFSFYDNRTSMAIVAYDENGQVAQRWDRDGARYVWSITIDATARTVSFHGQVNPGPVAITMSWDELWIG